MDSIQIAMLVFRWLHILAAITLMGGTIFMRFALVPAAATLADDAHQQLKQAVLARWKFWVMTSISFLLISGLTNFILTNKDWKIPQYHMLFGIKFLLALPIFFIASLLTGRTALAEKIRQNAKFWLTVNLLLATAVVCIGGVMRARSYERIPKNLPTPAVTMSSQLR